ncbi:MAG TPA: hypothetical protein DEH22_07965 [Chloroflexi bacterium]|nr:hypothetical protein [Chloroflexota bacterium]
MSDKKVPDEGFKPKGTLVILFIFLVTLIVLWGSVYVILLNRGVTL